ncbi:serine hydrolase domain-containing protein [Sediminicola arcticus]|jgi:CubicO group peptidase (beta-lactamase class C family)|uniref:Serine hydrolase domain-containing protein n=1 Tax=Sediminicola arcticus TaxID=1574308 RepID=A0ABV2SUK8_9FLAO
MKQIILLILTLALAATGCQNEKQDSNATSLEVYADSLFQASIDSAQIAGASILVFQKDKMLLNKSYGYASLELAAPIPSNGIFDIGSVTKQFTAAAILKLVETGKLSLNDDFTKYLEFDTKGRKITIAQLLDHTSGLAQSPTGKDEFTQMTFDEFPHKLTVQLVEPKEFLHEPGEALIYNNVAFVFLGLIIEKVSGQPYEAYLKETFFDPLGMHSTSFGSNSKVVKNKVNGYNYDPNGLQQMDYLNYYIPYSAGSLVSSNEDLLIWTRALHNGKVLSEPMYQSMISPSKLNDGTPVSYAKGLVNFSNYGYKEISHGGAIAGFSSFVQYYPDDDLYIITLVNTIGPKKTGRFFGYEITWKLLDKKEYEQATLDIDTNAIQGIYTGQTRGGKDSDGKQAIEIKSIENGITRQVMGEEKIDTLKVYVGNNTWMDGNDKIIIENNKYRVDKIYNYYILKKDNK